MILNMDNNKGVSIVVLNLLIIFNIISYLYNKVDNSKFEIFLFLAYYVLFLIYYKQFYYILTEEKSPHNNSITIKTEYCDKLFEKDICIIRSVVNLISYVIFLYSLLISNLKRDYYLKLTQYEQTSLTINFLIMPITLSYISYHNNIKKILLYDNMSIYDEENGENKKYTQNKDGYVEI